VYRTTQLENGVRVATAEMPHMTSVSVGIWVGVGSRFEPARLNGACHFIEHMVFKGTRKRSARQISEAVEGIGGYLNAFTSEETTCFHARAAYERFDQLLDVLADMLLEPKFAPTEIEKERDVIKEEISMYLDQPHHQVQEVLNQTLWPDQALGRPITGTPATLDRIGRTLLQSYLRSHYVAPAVVIAAAGRISHLRMLKACKPYARRFSIGPGGDPQPMREHQATPRLKLVSRKTEQTQLALGIRTCSRHDPQRYPLRVLNTILGENMSSRLFQTIREDRGLAYSIYSSPSFFADTGDLVVSAGLDTENLEKTLKLILAELRRLADRSPPAAELRRASDYLAGQIDLGAESTDSQMNNLGEQLLGYGKILTASEMKRRLREVTGAEVRAVARQFFRPERFNLALVSPITKANGLMKLLSF
jgi:predicted Zn-dependent peptidase